MKTLACWAVVAFGLWLLVQLLSYHPSGEPPCPFLARALHEFRAAGKLRFVRDKLDGHGGDIHAQSHELAGSSNGLSPERQPFLSAHALKSRWPDLGEFLFTWVPS
jgi:hypothetical protein